MMVLGDMHSTASISFPVIEENIFLLFQHDFDDSIVSLSDLRPGLEVRGVVRNVTTFGAFVDVGVGTNGLLHSSKMRGHRQEDTRVSCRYLKDMFSHVPCPC